VELKNILARQPGPEVAEQVALYQGSLRGKTKQLKAMAAELNMAQAQVGARGGQGWLAGGARNQAARGQQGDVGAMACPLMYLPGSPLSPKLI
jgi:hypothetical protein